METYTRDGLTFDVRDAGPQDGEVVVLLHGFPQDGSCWDGVTPALHEAGLRTLAPDQRGYSPRAVPANRFGYSVPELVGDVLALIDASGHERVHLVGHDWGGAVAWALAERFPQRLHSLTVVSTPHHEALSWAMRRSDQWRKSSYMAFFQLPWLPEHRLAPAMTRFYVGTGMPVEHARRYVPRFSDPARLVGPLGWYRSMPVIPSRRLLKKAKALRGGGSSSRPSRPSTPRRITVPTTFIWGKDDVALGRAAAERTAENVSGDYRFVEVDGTHWLPDTHPRLVADAVLHRALPTG